LIKQDSGVIQEHQDPTKVKLTFLSKEAQGTLTVQRCELISTIHKSNIIKISESTELCRFFKSKLDECLKQLAEF